MNSGVMNARGIEGCVRCDKVLDLMQGDFLIVWFRRKREHPRDYRASQGTIGHKPHMGLTATQSLRQNNTYLLKVT
jgi:hypothetical protein